MKTYEFDEGNQNLHNEIEKNRKFSRNVLWFGLGLLGLIIIGCSLVFYFGKKSFDAAHRAGETALKNARNSIPPINPNPPNFPY